MKEKQKEYYVKLISAIGDVLNNPDNENHIDLREEGANATDFFYVLGGLIPTRVYSELVEETDLIDFNHLIIKLIIANGYTVDIED